jgi:hypothetical protein
MMPISKSQGEALTALLGTLRKDWNLAGIRAAIRKASLLGSPAEVAIAACRCAAEPTMRTPALIAEPGPHWQGTTAGTRQAPTMCQIHPALKAGGCPECVKAAVPMTPGEFRRRVEASAIDPETHDYQGDGTSRCPVCLGSMNEHIS